MEDLDLPGLEDAQLSQETLAQIHILNQSQKYVTLIVVSLLLSLMVMNGQKGQLLCFGQVREGDFLCCQFLQNILTLTALFFFYGLSKESFDTNPSSGSCLNLLAGVMVLAAGIIRSGLLIRKEK